MSVPCAPGDAYSGGSGAFYVSVGEDARQGVPWRQKMDDREYFEAWMASLQWWADPTKGPPER